MNIFSTLGGWLRKIFPHPEDTKVVLEKAAHIVDIAEPIIHDIEFGLKVIDPTNKNLVITNIEDFLLKYEPDLGIVKATASNLAALPFDSMLHEVAVFVLNKFVPAGTAKSVLNLAIELAYNIFKQRMTAPAV